jgi:hypothetical protein
VTSLLQGHRFCLQKDAIFSLRIAVDYKQARSSACASLLITNKRALQLAHRP